MKKKKEYCKPRADVVRMEPDAILASCSIQVDQSKPQDAQDLENAGLQRDEEGFIWGD